ncbi:SAC3_GANP domain-containing protein [Cephalotus follicularis]|uniref:SAC3_GANP domain-containing protein n=1 Tax=Cephalotus follicularis TaxID=3775 RepID=A0A1Q3CAI4_CEPFO|nr:SAC3_GANP domain-containing protein [Cephalotus follicularis]
MMNQGVNTQTISSLDPNSLENRYAVDASKGQTSPYLPSTTGSEAASWTMSTVDYRPSDNGHLSNATYHHEQHVDSSTINVQEGVNATSLASSSNHGTTNVNQEYNGYASYPTPTDPYGYGSTGYPGYYNGYQQQPNYSFTQPVGAYQSTSESYQSTSGSYQNTSGSYQHTSASYPNTSGAYQNTGAPYQPLSSFQNAGSYAGPASYSSTYYNPADYQTTGGYPSNGYSNQTTSWNDANYANYASHQYPNYTSDTTSAYSSSNTATTSLHYQQHYKQWAEYYSQTEVSCAPGTENLSVSSTSNPACPAPAVSGGYPTSTSQPQPTFTSSWGADSSSSQMPSLQTGAAVCGAHDSYWKHGSSSFQDHHGSPMQPQFQKPVDSKSFYDTFQDQQKTASSQGSNSQYHASNQVTPSYQEPSQTFPSADTRRVSKLQIPTNPRIASNLTLGLPKTDKDSSTTSVAAKPAYISVSVPKPNDAASSILKSGMFPKSLRGYVERALARCKDDTQVAACQGVMKEIITNATADGSLHTRDWDTEPLFPLPNADVVKDLQSPALVTSLPKYKRSPSRRSKSRWEPLPEEKSVDKVASGINDTVRFGGWLHVDENDTKSIIGNHESKEDGLGNIKFPLFEKKSASKIVQRPVKRHRLVNGLNAADSSDASDSDKEQSLTAYYSSSMALADTPDERKRREHRSKRFERIQGHRSQINHFKPQSAGSGNLYTRRASALVLSKNFEDGGSRAVEDIDWDALTVKGTCQEIEKRYLRLTSAPDPSTVRPEEVLEQALQMVQNSQKNYLYKCDQLKSIRQDLTVQRIRNQLTVKVYETHARLALEVGDLPEYNQCQSQLKILYAEGIEGCHMEFSAYNLLCVILHSNNYRELLSSMSRLSDEAKKDKAVKHALAVRAAVTSENYVLFFRLYKAAPNLNTCLMDLYVEKMRYKAVNCMSRSYRPTVPVSYIAQVLGFTIVAPTSKGSDEKEKDSDGLEECIEWLKAHGACLVTDNNGEMQLDAKVSSSSLYMPEPEDAVAHGDPSLDVNVFLTRTSS